MARAAARPRRPEAKGGRSTSGASAPDCCPSLRDAPLDAASAGELARGFAALGDVARVQILSLLAAAPAGEVCVCDLVGPLGKAQPTVSHHLKILAEAGLVEGERRGRWVWYRLVPARLAALQASLAAG